MRTGVAIQTSNYDWDNFGFNSEVFVHNCIINKRALMCLLNAINSVNDTQI
jgi:hypothetical protein